MIQQTINIAGIMEDSIVDGPGLRTAIFAQGCPRRCEGCHNPESWAFGTGTDMTVQDLFWRVKKNPLVRGVTFSGGEPFSQAEPFTELAKLLKANGYEVASYTGYTFEELLENGTPAPEAAAGRAGHSAGRRIRFGTTCNLDLRFRGSENQRIPGRTPEPCSGRRAAWCTAARWVENGSHNACTASPRHNRNPSRAHLMRARLCLSKKGNFVCEVRKIALLCAGKER